ncbi:MAG: YdbH domain-containing protein, partial [Marinomonas sp.]
LTASVTAKQTGSVLTAVIPEARLTNGAGEVALAISQLQYRSGEAVGAQLSGNFVTAGRDLPQMRGRMEQNGGGALAFRAQMDEFREGDAALALPQMEVQQLRGGAVQFDGRVIASGAIPGGMMRELSLPIEGDYSRNGVLTMGRKCTDVSFAALTLDSADLALNRRNIRMCPKGGAPLLTYGGGGMKFGAQLPALAVQGQYGGEAFAVSAGGATLNVTAGSGSALALSGDLSGLRLKGNFVGVPVNAQSNKARFAMSSTPGTPGFALTSDIAGLDMTGRLGSTPFALTTGAVDIGWPGRGTLRNAEMVIGSADAPNLFTIAEITGDLGERSSGTFAGAQVLLDAVPMDITEAAGEWGFADGILALNGATFNLFDREEVDRFEPLMARDATLTLEGNQLAANALIRHPATDTAIAGVDISHHLSRGTGSADLKVSNLTFGKGFQPEDLTQLVVGVVALAEGRITGTGRIDWTADTIDSFGTFSTDDFDFAAAFGPVQGAKGSVTFTDLINLTTAPDQTITLASINPGIEVLAGEVTYEVRDAQVVDVKAAQWPFMGGTLIMKPVVLDFSQEEVRAYVFQMEGLDAGTFIAQMELTNLSASGKFDGKVPIIFDKEGNGRIQNSVLVAQQPGGNVSYVGALTYEDMGFVSNFAFNMLKSIDYTGMEIRIDGPLTGNLITKVKIDGVQQGVDASRNILTREIAKLPIQLNVNVNAPFYEMMTTMRSLYDPEFIDTSRIETLTGRKPLSVEEQPTEEAPVEEGVSPEPLLKPRDIDETKPTIQLEESERLP